MNSTLTSREHQTQSYAFDLFVVDAGKSVLLRDGQLVPLTPKAFEILLVLVRQPGRVLKKEELFQLVWPDSFVEENNLPRNISALRKALGEEPTEHKYIVTVPGQGYRFVANVRELPRDNGHAALIENPERSENQVAQIGTLSRLFRR